MATAAASGLRVMTTSAGRRGPMTTRRQRNRQRMRTDTVLLRSRCHACAFASGTASLRSAAQLSLHARLGGNGAPAGTSSGASPACCCVLLPGHECDSEQSPDPTQDSYVCGVHSVSSLCKMYFRELPNPLLSDRLYEQLSDTVLYHSTSPCGCLLLPQSCSHWRRHRHRHEATATLPLCQTAERLKAPQLYRGNFTRSVAFHPKAVGQDRVACARN
eukprot:XP_025011727.1 rho GTPase-activating protein 33-like isoform X2 [Gallus gallus]